MSLEIKLIDSKIDIANNAVIFADYVNALGVPGTEDNLMIQLFTALDKPGTILIMAFESGNPVGFLMASPGRAAAENFLMVREWYSKTTNIGKLMFQSAAAHAKNIGLSKLKGVVKQDKVKAVKRMLGAEIEASVLFVELG